MLSKNEIELIKNICRNTPVKRLSVFGSYAKNQENNNSDIDIIIDPDGEMTLISLIMLENLLHKKLNKRVDLLTRNSLNKYLKPGIEQEELLIYEK